MQRSGHSAYVALITAVVFWGLSFVATKLALESLPTFTLIFARFALASCLFLTLMGYQGRPQFTRRAHRKVFLMALFEPGSYFVFETIGLQHTTAPKASLIIATIPVAVVVLGTLLLHEHTKRGALLGMGASLTGIVVLVTADPEFRWAFGGHLLGDLLIFGAVISAALYTVLARDLGRDYSALDITGMQVIYGAVLYAPAFLWEFPTLRWTAISAPSLAALAYLTLFATIGAFLCYNYALTRLAAYRAAVFINGVPVVTALGAWVILGEKLTLIQAFGGTLVLLGVWLTSLLSRAAR